MYESPKTSKAVPKPYRHRPQDSFHTKTVESAEGEDRQTEESPRESVRETVVERDYIGAEIVEHGVELFNIGEYEEALRTFRTALKTQRVSLGDEHVSIALTLGNIGSVCLKLGDLDAAEISLEESLKIKSHLSPTIPIADTLNNLGNVANMRGDYPKSLSYYKKALHEIRQGIGSKCEEANILFNIGRLEAQQQQWSKALVDLEEACELTRETYGPRDARLAETLDLLGFVNLSIGDFDTAMISFTNALAIHRENQGPINLDVANSLLNIGLVRESKGDLNEAWEAFSIANDLFTRLNADANNPIFEATRHSMDKVERDLAKKSREKLIQKHKKARQAAKHLREKARETARLRAQKRSPNTAEM